MKCEVAKAKKRPAIWVANELEMALVLNRRQIEPIDGTLAFGREFSGFETSDKRVPAHQYYCRRCGEIFAGERRKSDLMAEHLRSHVTHESKSPDDASG
jgi:hypothetical protein